ncbi:MAG: Zn-dependent hydrolase of the beta-lactamase fold-like protein [Chloroflexi bacterium]|jgi:L-ascorbate metabolism protein UlaG (beta-lactamase superfamily)|nr:Zn-dependent hydrolase of the beta-lactamase fold-like protein [Chloroflexota bacterium]
MELSWYGQTCIRLRGKDAVVVADAYQSVVGPTGRGLTADIATFSHPDDAPLPRAKGRTTRDGSTHLPSSLDDAFLLDGPGEYEIRHVLVNGVLTFRDDRRGAELGRNVVFVVELDGIHTAHLGVIGHLLTEEKVGEVGSVDVVCVPIGGALSATKAAELVAQLDPRIVVPMPVDEADKDGRDPMARFLHEMGTTDAVPQQRLSLTPSSLPSETTTFLLEQRGKQ